MTLTMTCKLQKAFVCLLLLAMASMACGVEKKDRADTNAAPSTATASPSANASDDVLLQAMKTELERSKSQLKLEQMGSPYYIEFRVTEMNQCVAEAALGALRQNICTHFRFARVVVKVGDYKQDSFSGEGQGQGVFDIVSMDDDVLALRHQLWLATDRAYKGALEALSAKKAQLKQYTAENLLDDFAQAPPVQSIMPPVKLDVDLPRWTRMIKQASAVYKNDPAVQNFDASLQFMAANRYLINSEGTVVRDGKTLYQLNTSGSTQATDGMRLDRDHGSVAANMKELPSDAEFLAQATKLLASLKQLRDAPLADEEYRGPVLFSADASASIFGEFVGENVLGRKPGLGQSSRTTGAYSTNYKTRVLPEFLSVVDDPTISTLKGQPLLGDYSVDDEGVKAQRVSLIEFGKLVNYLVGREPIRDFPVSNGHGRARVPANAPGPSLGNLIVSTSQPVSVKELKERLIKLARDRDLPYGYYVETMGPRHIPRLLYKVWVKDGHEELVRGGVFGSLDTRALRDNLIAAGDDMNIDNLPTAIPHSIVTPSVLFDELEVKRSEARRDKLPEYPAPGPGGK
jgi:microcin-processing metallopeptidase PmbA/TldD-like protein